MQDAATNLPSPADQTSADVDAAAAGAGVVVPRLLAFYRDAWSDDGTLTGWHTVAWGLVLPDGSAVTIPFDPPTRVTLWHSIDDAADALDAYVDSPTPRRWQHVSNSDEERDRASSTQSRGSLDGIAAQPASSLDPAAPAAAAGSRPLGRDDAGSRQ